MNLLPLIPALPLAGALLLTFFGGFFSRRVTSILGVASVGLSAVVAALIAFQFVTMPLPAGTSSVVVWHWLAVPGLSVDAGLHLDALFLVMVLVVTFVSFLIHLYSIDYMSRDEGYRRFFAYMNLFVAAMLILVLADDLLFLLLGWEGVGLCSYLLIGFWYKDPKNGFAAQKAFIVTRIGDAAFIAGLLLLFHTFGTLSIPEILAAAPRYWATGDMQATLAAGLLLGGALGKSAQLPMQVWLPDAMAGPTPVSALIHAATMVTAGVYLIARLHALFLLAPAILTVVAWIGAVTLIIAGVSAVAAVDLKRILAFSTISQIGYMFLALGVGAWPAAIFHLMTHAFFKALLFLSAGVVILKMNDEHNIFAMGGLRHSLPVTFWTFLAGAASLVALPWLTAGYYSKDMILIAAWTNGGTFGISLWLVGICGAFLSSLYAFRMVFAVFFGKQQAATGPNPVSKNMQISLLILAFLSLAGGLIDQIPHMLSLRGLTDFLETTLPVMPVAVISRTGDDHFFLKAVAISASLAGVVVAFGLYGCRRKDWLEQITQTRAMQGLRHFFAAGWGMDSFYNLMFVRPYQWCAAINKDDVVDRIYIGLAVLTRNIHQILSRTQSGRLRWYVATLAWGAVIFAAIGVLL